jgi:hypothetical protein
VVRGDAQPEARQITEAFPWDTAPKYLIRDNDRAFGAAFRVRVRAMGIRDRPTSFRSPWQNGLVERLIGSARPQRRTRVVALPSRDLPMVTRSVVGPNSVIAVMSAPLFHRKRKSIRDLAMSQTRTQADSCIAAKRRLYSITSSARASIVGGTSSPRALAVLRLMTSSNLTPRMTGRVMMAFVSPDYIKQPAEETLSVPHSRHVAAQPGIEAEAATGMQRKEEHQHRKEEVGPRPFRRTAGPINAEPQVQRCRSRNPRNQTTDLAWDASNEARGCASVRASVTP